MVASRDGGIRSVGSIGIASCIAPVICSVLISSPIYLAIKFSNVVAKTLCPWSFAILRYTCFFVPSLSLYANGVVITQLFIFSLSDI